MSTKLATCGALIILLMAGCCRTPVRPSGATVPLSQVLTDARREFQELKRYYINQPGARCPLRLAVDNYQITVLVKSTPSRDVKTSGGIEAGTGLIKLKFGPTFEDVNSLTTSTAVSWQRTPQKADGPLRGVWNTTSQKTPNWGTWVQDTVAQPAPDPTWLPAMLTANQFAASRQALAKASDEVAKGKISKENLPSLGDLVIDAIGQMVASSSDSTSPGCVYPTSVEIHAGFEIVKKDDLAGSITILWLTSGHDVSLNSDHVQDMDLKLVFTSNSQTLTALDAMMAR
jgi:hypothetical protein